MTLGRAPGRTVAPLAALLCLVALGAALVSLGFAQEVAPPAHYDGDDDDAGIEQKFCAAEPLFEAAVLGHTPEPLPSWWLGRPALDPSEPRPARLDCRSVPRGPPA